MIKRNTPSKFTASLVNTAQDEHFNIADGIMTNVPITNNTSVVKSVNFVNENDGSYTLRTPLILKERTLSNTWYLYDKEHLLSFDSSKNISITNPENTEEIAVVKFKYIDKTITVHELPFSATADKCLDFISEIISINSFREYTLASVKINLSAFASYITDYNTAHSTSHSNTLVYADTNYSTLDDGKVYRFLKIYQDMDAQTLTWIVELVYPELNSITAATNTQSVLDVNLLADNPYAIRDLYKYGYLSTTKILPYVPVGYSAADIADHTICQLTESIPATIGGTLKGYRLLISANPNNLVSTSVILKAFLTTAATKAVYYGVWEESSNEGVDWKICPEFISKFENSITNPIVKKYVSDLTSEDFEKIAYNENLDQAASYLVEKQMVRLNYKGTTNVPEDLAETDLIKNRPDVLLITSFNPSKRYRFQVYVDTLKETPTPKGVSKNYSIYAFSALNGDIEEDHATYTANSSLDSNVTCNGKKYITDPEGYVTASPILSNNCIVLYPSNEGIPSADDISSLSSSKLGNAIRIDCVKRSTSSKVKKIVVTTSKNACYLSLGYTVGGTFTVPAAQYAEKNSAITFDVSEIDAHSFYIFNRSLADTDNSTVAYIAGIKVVYELEGAIQTTSVYLSSSTGTFSVPYSESVQYAELLKNERRQLFYGQFFENNNSNQMMSFNKYSLFTSNLDSNIFSAIKTITFGTELVSIINWRNYLLAFTEKDIYLLKYDAATDYYNIKPLSNSIGIPKKDANTIVCILNSIYFKSGYRIYKLVPNLYASIDDILNIHPVSNNIDKLMEDLLAAEIETNNFVYANAYKLYVFIPILNKGITYCFVYDLTDKTWNLLEYPTIITNVENLGVSKEFLKTEKGIYYFKNNIQTLLKEELLYNLQDVAYIENDEEFTISTDDADICIKDDSYDSLDILFTKLPHVDFLDNTLKELYSFLKTSGVTVNTEENKLEDTSSSANIQMYPIQYLIDFGQKSSNYTLYKTFLETKITLATLHEKDTFPFELYITTDGIETPLHWDVNTDSALWKNSFLHKGTVGTQFTTDIVEYNGIIRQLIIKYSGKGKTIHHTVTGKSMYNFKFYSMDVKSRILPKKQ